MLATFSCLINKVPSKRQHNFETNKGLIFDYAPMII